MGAFGEFREIQCFGVGIHQNLYLNNEVDVHAVALPWECREMDQKDGSKGVWNSYMGMGLQ